MDLSIIPAIGLLLVIVFTIPEVSNSDEFRAEDKKIFSRQSFLQKPQVDPDFEIIHDYITHKYKKIPTQDAKQIASHLVAFGKKHQVDPKLAAALIARESAFNRKAISSTGAKGLGQIKDFNYKDLKINDPYDIKQNVSGTVKYLKEMTSKWKGKPEKVSLALASYYKGYTAVKKDDAKIEGKTKQYVTDILDYYKNLVNKRKEIDSQ
jgi:soluble lytic murein transglycosylase-like protein